MAVVGTRAAHRLRERRQPAARPRGGAPARDRGPARARRRPRPARPSTADRELLLVARRRARSACSSRDGAVAAGALLSTTRHAPLCSTSRSTAECSRSRVGVAVLTGILFGLAPAWRSERVDPQRRAEGAGAAWPKATRASSIGKALVVGQIALSLVLVAGAGLLLGSFRGARHTDPGFADRVCSSSTDIRAGRDATLSSSAMYRRCSIVFARSRRSRRERLADHADRRAGVERRRSSSDGPVRPIAERPRVDQRSERRLLRDDGHAAPRWAGLWRGDSPSSRRSRSSTRRWPSGCSAAAAGRPVLQHPAARTRAADRGRRRRRQREVPLERADRRADRVHLVRPE